MATPPPKGGLGLRKKPGLLPIHTPKTGHSQLPSSPDKGYYSSELNGFHVEEPPNKQPMFHDSRTGLIIKRIFFILLTQAGIDKSIVRMLNVEHHIAKRTEADKKLIIELTDKFVEYVQHSRHTSIEVNLKDFHQQQWRIDSTNMYTEFKKVSNETFRGRKHWGKVVGFITFSVGYAIYVHNNGIKDAVVSVEAWTRQVMEEDVAEFFIQTGGWENLLEFVSTLVKRQRREREQEANGQLVESQDQTPLWQNVVALGTVAAGAVVAFTLTKAFT